MPFLSRTLGTHDRAQALDIVQLYFLPGCTLEMAYNADQTRELSAYINGSLSYTRLRPATAQPTTCERGSCAGRLSPLYVLPGSSVTMSGLLVPAVFIL